jgi:hypothetical protein
MNSKILENKDKVSLKDFIYNWNEKFPFDLWFRKKYNFPFNGNDHKNTVFLDEAVEFLESKYIELEELQEQLKTKKKEFNNFDDKDVIKMSKKEVDKEFDELDI